MLISRTKELLELNIRHRVNIIVIHNELFQVTKKQVRIVKNREANPFSNRQFTQRRSGSKLDNKLLCMRSAPHF